MFSLISPGKFEQLFAQWAQSLIETKIPGEVIAIDGKAIPELLNILDIEGCIITIDAMGTQKKMPREKETGMQPVTSRWWKKPL